MDAIADQPAAGFECDIPVKAPILALELSLGYEAGVGGAPRAFGQAVKLHVERDFVGQIADNEIAIKHGMRLVFHIDPRAMEGEVLKSRFQYRLSFARTSIDPGETQVAAVDH